MDGALRRQGRRVRAAQVEPAYAAFLSYSHAVDDRLAEDLQRSLQRFAKPWYRRRALLVFRDQANLSANPALWPTIQEVLRRSESLILLACPEAAASWWVQQEVAYWLDHHEAHDRLLIVLTGGMILWDRQRGDFDWDRTDALPPLLSGVFADEPLFIDLRWARDVEAGSLRDARFQDCVGTLAAPLHGRPKDDLVGEDLHQHRRTVLLAQAAIGSLAALTAAASVAGVVAVAQRNEARAERDRAEQQERIASAERDRAETQQRLAGARLLATQARNMLDERPDRALLLAAAAVHVTDSPDARDALLRTLQRTDNVTAYLHPAGQIHALAFSPDGRLLATGHHDRTVQVWDVTIAGPRGPPRTDLRQSVQALEFHPTDGSVVSLDRRGRVVRWDPSDGITIGRRLGNGEATQLAVHPDGVQVAVGDLSGHVAVWDLDTEQKVLGPIPWLGEDSLDASVGQLTFSPDGRWLGASSFTGRLVIRDADNLEVVPTLDDDRTVTSFAFNSDGGLLARGHDDGSIVIVSLPDGERHGPELTGHDGAVNSLAFAPSGGELLSGGADHTLQLWELDGEEQPSAVRTAHGAALTHVRFAPDGQTFASAGRDGLVAIWQRPSQLLEEVFVEDGTLRSVALSADAEVAAFGYPDRGLFSRRLDDLDDIHDALPRSAEWTETLALTADGSLAASSGPNGSLALWDLTSGRPVGQPLDLQGGRMLLHTLLALIKTDPDADTTDFLPLAFSPDGTLLASANFDSRIAVWSIDDTRLHEPLLEGHIAPVMSLAFSPDGSLLTSGELTGDVRMWNVASGTAMGEPLQGHATGVRAVTYSPDGSLLASGAGDGTVQLWSVADKATVGDAFTGHTATITALAFSPDGTYLASGDSTGLVRLWDLAAHQALGEPLDWHLEAIRALAFTAEGSELVSAGRDGTVRWPMDFDGWVELACSIANRDLRPSEWEQLVGDGLPRPQICATPD